MTSLVSNEWAEGRRGRGVLYLFQDPLPLFFFLSFFSNSTVKTAEGSFFGGLFYP